MIELIRAERNGKVIEKMQIRSAVQLLIEVGIHSRKIYEQEFEAPLLQETTEFYHQESNRLITQSNCPQYLQLAADRLKQEQERVNNYLSPSSETVLIQAFLDEYICDQHTQTVLEMEESGLFAMIRNNKLLDLTLLYQMLQRRKSSFDLMRKKLSDYIIEEGMKLVADQSIKIEDFVLQLMNLRDLIYTIYTTAMNKDPAIDLTVKLAFERICNQDNKTAKALVTYLDEIFKKELRTNQEEEIHEKLEKTIQIFRYLTDKDVFEQFYTQSLSKRLLDSRILNEDAERILLLKLKEECGFAFTQRLEVMYKDMKLSEEITKDFRNMVSNQPIARETAIDMHVKVLTTGNWPNDQRE